MELRDYQSEMLDQARAHMRAGRKRILLQLPTGGGKTVMAATMLGGASTRSLRSHFLVHRRELIEQTSTTFHSVNIRHGFIASGMATNSDMLVQLVGVQTLVNRLRDTSPPHMIVVDECHHAVAGTWARVMAEYPDAYIIGLTATPQRLDGRGLADQFDVIVRGPSVSTLIERGFLSRYSYFAPTRPALDGVKTVAGDFSRGDLASAMDKPKLIGDIVEHYLELAPGERGIVFAASRQHSRNIADAFQARGIRAAHVDGSMSDSERAGIVGAFRAGDIDIMTNVDLFGEGFDVPGIVYCGLARPTKSLSLYLQQVGRALRIMPGKDQAIICDHAGNVHTHGLPDEDREWTLEGRKKSSRASAPNDAMSIRQCVECYRVNASTSDHCVGCGTVFPVRDAAPEQVAGTLSKIEQAEAKAREQQQRKQEERQCRTLEDWKALAKARGYKPGWAFHQYSLRQKYRRAA